MPKHDGSFEKEPFAIFNKNQRSQMAAGEIKPNKPKKKKPIEGQLTKVVKRAVKAVKDAVGD
jgi:hypothetical protein